MAETFDNDFKAEMLDFKDQMLRFVEIAGQKFDGLASDIRDNSFRIDKVEQSLGQKIDVLNRKVSSISSKIDQVTEKVVSHEKRLRGMEENGPTSPSVN